MTCCPKNTLICKLDLVYRYIVCNEKPVYGLFTHILLKENIIVDNHLYTKFGKKTYNNLETKNVLFLPMHGYLFFYF